MEKLTTKDFLDMMNVVIDTIIENESYFCELDSVAGDGDFGSSLAKGFRSLKKSWKDLNKEDIGSFMRSCGMIIIENCGGASGPIWGTAFVQAGRYAKDKGSIDLKELSELSQSMVNGVQKIGGANIGDKTLLDTLIPAAESLKSSALKNENMITAIKECVEAAENGAENTKKITAKKGRSSYVGDRSIGYYDPGAKAVAVILNDVLNKYFLR